MYLQCLFSQFSPQLAALSNPLRMISEGKIQFIHRRSNMQTRCRTGESFGCRKSTLVTQVCLFSKNPNREINFNRFLTSFGNRPSCDFDTCLIRLQKMFLESIHWISLGSYIYSTLKLATTCILVTFSLEPRLSISQSTVTQCVLMTHKLSFST